MGLRGLNAAGKAERARKVLEGLSRNDVFADVPALLLEALSTRTALLEKSLELAEFGDKRALSARKLCERELEAVLRQAATYVEHHAAGDEQLIRKAGFDLRSANNRTLPVAAPSDLKIKRTEVEGELLLSWKPVPNSKNYLVQTCTKEPDEKSTWHTHEYSTKSRCTVSGLKPGTRYWIRVLAIGAAGIGPPSEVKNIMAA